MPKTSGTFLLRLTPAGLQPDLQAAGRRWRVSKDYVGGIIGRGQGEMLCEADSMGPEVSSRTSG